MKGYTVVDRRHHADKDYLASKEAHAKTHVWKDSQDGKWATMRCDECQMILTIQKDVIVRVMG